MPLLRAILFTCLIYFSQELRLSKRAIEDGVSTHTAIDHESIKAAEPASDAVKVGVDDHVNSKDDVHTDIHSESKYGEEKTPAPKNVGDHFPENHNERASHVTKSEVVLATERYAKLKSYEHLPIKEHIQEQSVQSVSESDAKNIAASEFNSAHIDEPKRESVHVVSENATEDTAKKSKREPDEPLDVPVDGRRSNRPSNWCQNLQDCRPNRVEVCGYDDKAGFAKFTDFCHMMEVNCHWGHDFTLHTCQAMQIKQMGRPRNLLH